ncbi:(Fe-S)-binding protein [Lihuaxuella thermophila]|uniref:L-lactate dehydrogenase complex protein LldE n=1 Tax=Lihuaxuella thermophila TaxID=1173111 RepID=A0A1H8EVH8_9BACL|nr:(Fe-S)-binding protein [Lihuaxuella thermophila]SEN23475.1 L-lactate dehydrogenase complex protein LldE [Lihuaxuella thermophila]
MRVSLFITCLCDAIYPQVGEAMARLLNRYGIRLDFPESQTCCGQPPFNTGYWDAAKESAKTMIRAFAESDFVIAPSGSCVGMIHHHYPTLFKDDPEWLKKARHLIEKTYEFSQFLVHVLDIQDVGATFPHKVTYHPSCHGSRLLGVKEEPYTLLSHVRGCELIPLPFAEDCCGFGGTFSVKLPDVSGAMVCEKVRHITETKAEVLVGLDMACLMNIACRLQHEGKTIRVMHLAELLYEGVKQNA